MKSAKVVIGAAFGDEGKGLLTDYYSSLSTNPIVVRFNGGAQAGHTVVAPDGRRHVFSHFGAGTFAGAATYLSKYFLVNPQMWALEYDKLKDLNPFLYIDPECLVTTPFDMAINQFAEEHRGQVRHGSCGMGINETVVRSEKLALRYKSTFTSLAEMRGKLAILRDIWVPMRMHELGIPMTPERHSVINSTKLINDFLVTLHELHEKSISTDCEILESRDVIFEGAQGLLLDEEHQFFPHVTRSKTGLANVVKIARDAGIQQLDVTYVTRSYTTRHGNGPFPTEIEGLSYEDLTNNPNNWQGALRFGALDLDLIGEAVEKDLSTSHAGIKVNSNLAVTHLDQTDALMVRIGGQDYHNLPLLDFLDYCKIGTGLMPVMLVSGPTRNDVKETNA